MQEGKGTKEADQAIKDASTGKIQVSEMILKITAAQVFIPLSAPPVMDGDKMKSWQPATVTHSERGDFVLAFTNDEIRRNWHEENQNFTYGMMMETQFLINVLPPNHGILFNLGGESCFEWDKKGINAYQETMAMKKKQSKNSLEKTHKAQKKQSKD